MINYLPNIKVISRLGIGLENIDIEEQSFWVPPIKNIAVALFLDPYETQVINQEITVSIFQNDVCKNHRS